MSVPFDRFVPAIALTELRAARAGRVPPKRMRELTVLIVDIEGCTRLCEDLPPRQMNALTELYFSRYLDAVRAFGGEVTEVLGDGLLVLFKGRDLRASVRAAVSAIYQIQALTASLNRRRSRSHDPVTVNVGLNAGRALTGITRLRSRSGERWVYAANGPLTNVASRLCALASGGQVLATKSVAELMPADCAARSLGPKRLKNVSGSVEVFEIQVPRRTPSSGSI